MARKPRTRKRPVCFFGVPKCASSSISKLLAEWDNTWKLLGDYDYFSKEHLPTETVSRLWSQGWWFTFVRNPWARVISAWQMFEQNPKYSAAEVGGRSRTLVEALQLADIDWAAFAKLPQEVPFPRHLWGVDVNLQNHLMPCTVASPLDKMHFIGQVESIETDWNTVQDCTGIRVALGRHNTTEHKPYRHYYNAELRDLVARIYREDIERFSYSF